jgi:hypothetical protein
MFENTFIEDRVNGISLSESFYGVANRFGNIKMRCVKSLYKNDEKNEVTIMKEGVLELLKEVRNLWSLFIDYNGQLNMKIDTE